MNNFKPAHMIGDYEITFYESGKIIGRIVLAAPDSLVAENAGQRMAASGVTVKVKRH